MNGRPCVAINDKGYRIGQGHHRAELSDHEVDLMRELHENHGKGWKWLSKCFEIPKRTVRDICNYKVRAQTPDGYRTVKKDMRQKR